MIPFSVQEDEWCKFACYDTPHVVDDCYHDNCLLCRCEICDCEIEPREDNKRDICKECKKNVEDL